MHKAQSNPNPVQYRSIQIYQLDGDLAPAPACECMCSLTLQCTYVNARCKQKCAVTACGHMLVGMSRDVQWTDSDPETGERRFVSVEMFARKWEFKTRAKRRENWRRLNPVPRDMWETLLEALERRYHRREGVSDEDLIEIRRILSTYKPAPIIEVDIPEST